MLAADVEIMPCSLKRAAMSRAGGRSRRRDRASTAAARSPSAVRPLYLSAASTRLVTLPDAS
jgi:hypothetical protein